MSEHLLSVLKRAAVLAAPLFLVFIVWQLAVAPILDLYRDLDEDVRRSQALVLRYRSLVNQEAETKAALASLQGNSGGEDLFYKSANVNAAATLLQQKLGELVTATGGQIRTARVEIKPKTAKTADYQTFTVDLTFATSSAGLAKLLFQLEMLRPIVFVDRVIINASPALLAEKHDAKPSEKDKRAAEDQVLDVALTAAAFTLVKV